MTIPVGDGASTQVGVVVSPDGRVVYVATGGNGRVSIFTASRRPWGVALIY